LYWKSIRQNNLIIRLDWSISVIFFTLYCSKENAALDGVIVMYRACIILAACPINQEFYYSYNTSIVTAGGQYGSLLNFNASGKTRFKFTFSPRSEFPTADHYANKGNALYSTLHEYYTGQCPPF
jgi:hypothetical protein